MPFRLATLIYPAYRIWHSNRTLLVSSTSYLIPYLPVIANTSLSCRSRLSFPNHISREESICGKMTELQGTEPIIILHHNSSSFLNGIHEKERFVLEECRKRVWWYDTIQLWGSTQLCGSTGRRGKSDWDYMMRNMKCIIHCIVRKYEIILESIYPGVSRIYTPHRLVYLCMPTVIRSIIMIPVSLSAPVA